MLYGCCLETLTVAIPTVQSYCTPILCSRQDHFFRSSGWDVQKEKNKCCSKNEDGTPSKFYKHTE